MFEFGLDDRPEHVPAACDIANDHDFAWCKCRGDHAQPTTQKRRHLFQCLDGVNIVGLSHLYQGGEVLRCCSTAKLFVVAKTGTIGANGLPTAAATATAQRAVGLHLDVAKLSRHAVGSSQ